ncbi:MAG: hypothetical protein WCB19_07105 [Thermoplasmata archaeon]
MSAGLIAAYLVSYWTYYQGFLCSLPCAPGPRIGVPYFSIELTVLLVGMALVPFWAALDFRWVSRYVAGVSALSVGFIALANLILPLSFVLGPYSGRVLEFGPLPWVAPPLTLLLVAAGCAVAVSGLESPERVRLRDRFVRTLGVSGALVVAVFWPLAMLVLSPNVPFDLASPMWVALFYAIPAVIILSLALASLAPGVPRYEPSTV